MFSQIQQSNIDPNKYYVACLGARWGATAFMTAVEYKLFSPNNKELNDQFNLHTAQHVGFQYVVIEVPKEYKDRVNAIARKMGLIVTDGVPIAKRNDVETKFPIQGPNIGTLINQSRPPTYIGDHAAKYINEDVECENITRGGSPLYFERSN